METENITAPDTLDAINIEILYCFDFIQTECKDGNDKPTSGTGGTPQGGGGNGSGGAKGGSGGGRGGH